MPSENFLQTEVNPSGLTALIENLGRDCHPTQFLREFTRNAIEACQRTIGNKNKIIIDFNNELHEKHGLFKICFIDNGDGMSGPQMISLLNNLSASGDSKNKYKNYGVGAKISAMTRNHSGIQYESWKDNVGNVIFIKYNEDYGYGIQGATSNNGKTHYAIPLNTPSRPAGIAEHGTRVTLWGMSESQDTMMPPEGVGGVRESWLALYLNTRFFKFPEGIEISARIGYYRENNARHNYLLNIKGQKAILDEKSEMKGSLKFSDAQVYWWVMPKGIDGHGRELLKGHTALINQEEIFDISDSRSNRAAYFGIIIGRDRVIIYVEPENVMQNTARTNLVRPDGSEVSWHKWQDEFRLNMPVQLKGFLDNLQDESANESHTDSIKERLKNIKELYKLSRYKANSQGVLYADPNSEAQFTGGFEHTGAPRPVPPEPKPRPGPIPNDITNTILTLLVEENAGINVEVHDPNPFPQVKWVKASENDQLIDRAAEYVQTSNIILANSEFQSLNDLIKFFSKNYTDLPEVLKIIEDEVKEAFELALTECIAGALSLKNRPHWNPKEFDSAVSKEALTTAIMPRYWMVGHIKRALGNKLKAFNEIQIT